MKTLKALLVGVGSLTVCAHGSTNLINNGSFEAPGGAPANGHFTTLWSGSSLVQGWVVGGVGVDYTKSYAADGIWSVDLVRGPGQGGSLTQVVNGLVPGRRYYLSFAVAQGELSSRAALQVSIGSLSQTVINAKATGFETHELGFVATASSVVIGFAGPVSGAVDAGPFIDNVRLSTDSYFGSASFFRVSTGNIANDVGDALGCAWGDYDGDGYLDLVVGNSNLQSSFLYHNNRDGTFAKVRTGPVATSGGYATAAAWADYDNSGTLDLFIASYSNQSSFLFQNLGGGGFLQITNGPIVTTSGLSSGCAWADYDNDGNLDLFVANNSANGNYLYHGHGDGTFERVTAGTVATDHLPTSIDAAWGDYNNDGRPDLFLTGDNNALYRNDGNGQFTRITAGALVSDGATTGAAWGDYDNDGNLDLVTTGNGWACLYRNNGAGSFTKTVLRNPGKNLAGCAWGDYDNDGFLDLFLTDTTGQNNVLYHNNKNGTFSWVLTGNVVNNGGHSWCAAWGDYDNDGFLDLFVGNRGALAGVSGESNFLYHNNGNSNHWFNVNLVGTRSNRSGIGAKVRVKAVIGGRETWQLREVASGGSFGQASLNVHFGLADAAKVDTLRIEWPSGIVQEMQGISANQFLTITEPPLLKIGQGITPSGFDLILESRGGFNYDVQWSTDLITWNNLKSLKAVNGAVQVLDASARIYRQGFYRAVQR